MLLEFVRKKLEKEKADNHRRFEKAWQDFHRITALIIEKYNPIRIYQWGSLLNERHFSAISDIDIAVEGITDAETYFRMIGEADELTDFPLDIVQIEKIDPIHADSIRRKGVLIWQNLWQKSCITAKKNTWKWKLLLILKANIIRAKFLRCPAEARNIVSSLSI